MTEWHTLIEAAALPLAGAAIWVLKQIADEYIKNRLLSRIANGALLAAGRMVDGAALDSEVAKVDRKYEGSIARLVKLGVDVTRADLQDAILGHKGVLQSNAPAPRSSVARLSEP